MTEHRNPAEAKKSEAKKAEPKKRGASIYFDAPLRAEFLMILAMADNEGEEGWSYLKEDVLPRVLNEAREHSRTPKLDRAFIEGAVSALNAVRVLKDARKQL